jgi:hypothetical protein
LFFPSAFLFFILDAYYILFYDISVSLFSHSTFVALGYRVVYLVVKTAVHSTVCCKEIEEGGFRVGSPIATGELYFKAY